MTDLHRKAFRLLKEHRRPQPYGEDPKHSRSLAECKKALEAAPDSAVEEYLVDEEPSAVLVYLEDFADISRRMATLLEKGGPRWWKPRDIASILGTSKLAIRLAIGRDEEAGLSVPYRKRFESGTRLAGACYREAPDHRELQDGLVAV